MKVIPGYPDYAVTEDGRVFSIKRNKWCKNTLMTVGYYATTLRDANNNKKTMLLHRIVAMTFIHNTENKPCVNHLNGIKTDNRVRNLEWSTYAENNKHAHKTGLNYISQSNKIEASRTAKEKFSKIVLDTQTGIFYNSAREAAKAYNINSNTLHTKLNGNAKNNTTLIYA
jgi:hypothetical protein